MTVQFYATTDSDSIRPFMPKAPVMLPMASWWRKDVELKRPPRIPAHVGPIAVDTGSFTLAQQFDAYPFGFTGQSVVNWCKAVKPSWVVLPDWPMEHLQAERRVDSIMLQTMTAWEMIESFGRAPWAWCPVIQGWTVREYARSCMGIADLCYWLRDFYAERGMADQYRVCIGSICRRGQTDEIRRIVEVVAEILPELPLHLFGVKLDLVSDPIALPESVVSIDSAAWNGRFAQGIEEYRHKGMTQREYAWKVAYPKYAARLEAALARPKQLTLGVAA